MSVFTTRNVILATHGAVAAGHYLAAQAGLQMLEAGGNAIDAGVAAGFALAVLKPHQNGIAGEAPLLIHSAKHNRVFAINGNGAAPRAATLERFKELGINLIPGDGFLPAVVPAAVDAYLTALAEFGSLPLEAVLAPALDLAKNGLPMNEDLHNFIAGSYKHWQKVYPSTAEVFAPGGVVCSVGEVFKQPDWAAALGLLVEAERKAAAKGRTAALRAARDVFYKGEIAQELVRFARATEVMDASGTAHTALLSVEDFADYSAKVEMPVAVEYRGITVHKCNTWCQGPVFLQQLNLLEGYDLKALGHNTTEYIHTVIEAAKLAFADREAYYGDPDFVEVPLDQLLSKEYAAARRKLIDPARASLEDRPGGAPPARHKELHELPHHLDKWPINNTGDTTHFDAIDRFGNMISGTPSGGWLWSSPVIPGLGFPLGTRGQMFMLDPHHPNRLQPGKRPRSTLTPSLAMKDGRPYMVFGTPGGDCQDQWTLQFFLNRVDFKMNLQEAIDAPTFHTMHFRNSFYPRAILPGEMSVESRIPEETRKELEKRGHKVHVLGPWSNGAVLAVEFDPDTRVISAAASPRDASYAVGW